MANPRFLNLNRVPANFLSLRAALLLLLLEVILGVIGYIVLEDYNLADAFYMVVITISTVGFSEIEPLLYFTVLAICCKGTLNDSEKGIGLVINETTVE